MEEIKNFNSYFEDELNESHMSTRKDKLSFICDVLKDDSIMKEFKDEDVTKIYDLVEKILKEKDLYEDGKGLKK